MPTSEGIDPHCEWIEFYILCNHDLDSDRSNNNNLIFIGK